jgi:hypothetical protein
MRLTGFRWSLVAAAVVVALASPAIARASAVTDWNLNAADALSNAATATPPGAGQTPPVTVLHMAMVQGAVYDAVNAIAGGYQSYLTGLPAASSSASKDAAVATAAHDVLVGIIPALPAAVKAWLDTRYGLALAGIPDSTDKTNGVAIGAAAATAMLNLRANDGRFVAFSFTPSFAVGKWRPELPAFVSDPFAWVARVRPFMLESNSQFRSDGPDALNSGSYAKEFAEVKALGALNNSTRTDEQTIFARFYTDHATALWNRTFRGIADQSGLGVTREARLFAMLNMAGADSLIGCWDSKWYWSNWRPITAIRLADTDGNHKTIADPNWLPLITTPPYPDVPSGYNCITSAVFHTAQDFFGTDKLAFIVHSNVTNSNRSYGRFSDVWNDTVDARIMDGIHFRTADVLGVVLGKKVAHWLDKHYFQPTG